MATEKAFEVGGGGEALAFGALTSAEKDDSVYQRTVVQKPIPAETKGGCDLQATLAEELHHYFSECIRVADQKAAFLFVACSTLLAYLFDKIFVGDERLKSSLLNLETNHFALIAVVMAAIVALTFLVRSASFAIRISPRFWNSEQLRRMFRQAVAVDIRRTIIRTAIAGIFITLAFVFEKGLEAQFQGYGVQRTLFFAFFGVAVFFLVISAWLATRVVTPRLWPSHAPHMFWEDVYKKFPLPEDAEKYSTEVMASMSSSEFIHEKLRNCHDLAHLSHSKYHDLGRAIIFGRIGCMFTFVFFVWYFLGPPPS